VAGFLEAVGAEVELRADEQDATFGPPGGDRPSLATVYLGGGTPSLVPARDVAALLSRIEARFGLAADAEVTIEANPGPDERGDLAGLRSAGVTRISFGAQSFDAAELRRLGRRHRPGDVVTALEAAQRAGIPHRSLDLLYDTPGQAQATWQGSVEAALQTPIDHLSAYALTLEDPDAANLTGPTGDHLPVRRGARRWRRLAAAEQDDDRAADAYLWLDERLVAAGFGWYEVSNWARPGGASRHNQAYWRRAPMLGLGPGAHAFDGARRRSWNAARLDGYLAALAPADGSPPHLAPGGEDDLDDDAVRLERLSLDLRTRAGIARRDVPQTALAELDVALQAGLLDEVDDERLMVTARGRLMAGELAARLVA
jgi:oxygen-independent coproporphyrinogen-3 oxidase